MNGCQLARGRLRLQRRRAARTRRHTAAADQREVLIVGRNANHPTAFAEPHGAGQLDLLPQRRLVRPGNDKRNARARRIAKPAGRRRLGSSSLPGDAGGDRMPRFAPPITRLPSLVHGPRPSRAQPRQQRVRSRNPVGHRGRSSPGRDKQSHTHHRGGGQPVLTRSLLGPRRRPRWTCTRHAGPKNAVAGPVLRCPPPVSVSGGGCFVLAWPPALGSRSTH